MPHISVIRRPEFGDASEPYVPFGNMESRNGLQERIEIPLMIRALAIPKGSSARCPSSPAASTS